MDSEKVLLIIALVLFVSLLVIQLLKKQVRVATEAISKKHLESLRDDKSFKTLYLNLFSDASFVKRDTIFLQEHIEAIDVKTTYQKSKFLEPTKEKGEPLNREVSYSIYRLGKEEIKKILDHFPDEEVVNFLFQGTVYTDNDEHIFIAYKIYPADKSKRKLFRDWDSLRKSITINVPQIKEIKMDSVDSSDESLNLKRDFIIMKPSPPASRSIE